MLNIELARRNKKWTQTDLSAFARIDQTFVSSLERGNSWPTPDQRERIANALGVPADTLMEEVQPGRPKATDEQQQTA